MLVSKISNFQNTNFTQTAPQAEAGKSKEKLVKRAATIGSAIAVGTAYALVAKKQGFSLSPKKIYETPIKDWSIFRLYDKKHPNKKLISLEEKEILTLASSSVVGGFAGGALADDKKNLKAKGREVLNQLLGNVLVPVMCVGGVSRLYDKFKPQILKHVPQIKSSANGFKGKAVKFTNKFLKFTPSIVMTLGGLAAGILIGNKVSNFINDKIYHKKVDRKVRTSDFAPHVDDLSMAITLMADKSPISTAITNTVPLFLCVPGIETGTAIEK